MLEPAQVVPLDAEDGSALVVTVARYQTPSGRDINKKGIAPDVTVAYNSVPFEQACSVLSASDAPRLFR